MRGGSLNLPSISEDYNFQLGLKEDEREENRKGRRKDGAAKAGREARRLLWNEGIELKSPPKQKHCF